MKKKGQCMDPEYAEGEQRKQPQIREGRAGRAGRAPCLPDTRPAPRGEATLGMRRARRLDSSSLVVLRLSSLRLEGEDGRLSWASSSMSSWLCLLGNRGSRWLFLSDQFPLRRDWLLGFRESWHWGENMGEGLTTEALASIHLLGPRHSSHSLASLDP